MRLQIGCHIGGYWYGALGYADDLILLAPNREVLQRMLEICQSYAEEHNLVFSTDPVPSKSKTKCMIFCGKAGRVQYPDPVKLDGKDLPWVENADHLGHTLPQEPAPMSIGTDAQKGLIPAGSVHYQRIEGESRTHRK